MKKSFYIFYRAAVVVLLTIFSANNAWCFESGDTVTVGDFTYELHLLEMYSAGNADSAHAYIVKNENYRFKNAVTIPETFVYKDTTFVVRTISDEAFMDCTELESVTFSKNLHQIGNKAFKGCVKLTSVSLPNNILFMSKNAFDGCTGIKRVELNTNSVGEFFSGIRNQITEVVLGNDVHLIGVGAFYEFRNVKSFVLPDGISRIDIDAFKSCEGITSITLPAGLNYISPTAFNNCTNLTSITVSSKNEKYDSRDNCNAIIEKRTNKLVLGCAGSTIPSSVTEIGERAFYSSGIRELFIPSGVKKIGAEVFSYCSLLESLSVSNLNTNYDSRDDCNAIIEKNTHQLLYGTYKTTVIPETVSGIAPRAFAGVTKTFSITKLPESMNFDRINKQAFADCPGLESIVIPFNVAIIDTLAFGGCNNLKKFVIPENIYKINKQAFRDCQGLDTLVIPATVGEVGEETWMNCYALKRVVIENGELKKLPTGAFMNCRNLEEVAFQTASSFEIEDNAFSGCTSIKRVFITARDGCPKAADNAFGDDCSYLRNAVLYFYRCTVDDSDVWGKFGRGVDMTTLDHFDETYKLYINIVKDYGYNYAEVTSDVEDDTGLAKTYKYTGDIVIPEKVTIDGTDYPVKAIEEKAFMNHPSITSVTIGEELVDIGASAFEGCTGLTTLNTDQAKALYRIYASAFKGCSSLTAANLPDTTKLIGQEAFKGCLAMATLKLPVRLEELNEQAFGECKSLQVVDIPKTIKVIESKVFFHCDKLAKVTWHDSIHTIKDNAFGYCQALKDMTLPKMLQTIGNSAFRDCSALTDVTLPDSLKSIGEEAFRYCNGLTNILLPEKMKSMNSQVFANCGNLKTIALPEQMEIVDEKAFYQCGRLELVTIGEHVTAIGQEAFSGCPLRSIYCKAVNAPTVFSNSFSDQAYENATLFLPENYDEIYDKSLVWGRFKNGSLATYSLDYVVDGEKYKHYSVNGGAVVTPEPIPVKGTRMFSGWKGEPELMPAKDTTIVGSFMYDINFLVKKDGKILVDNDTLIQNKNIPDSLFYGSAVTVPQSWIEGYSIKWEGLPETMPARDTTIVGSFVVNKYAVIYYVDGEKYRCDSVEYNAQVNPPLDITAKTNYIFEWGNYPTTMPAKDVVVYGEYIPQVYVGGINIRIDKKKGFAKVIHYTASGINSKFAFNRNTKTDLTSVEVPDHVLLEESDVYQVKAIDDNAFNGFTQMTSVTLPETIETIGEQAFRDCRSLTSIALPDKVSTISYGTFMYCGHLEKVESETVKEIERQAFLNCSNLKYIDFKSIKLIEDQAFINCFELTDVHLYHISGISSEAFANDTKIARVYCDAMKVPQMAENAFENSVYKNAIVYVNETLLPEYQNNNRWNQFKRFDYISENFVIYMLDGMEYKKVTYKTGEEIVPEPNPTNGSRLFSGWSDIPAVMAHKDIVVTGNFRYILTYQFDGEPIQKKWVFCGTPVQTPAIEERKDHIIYWENAINTMPGRDTLIIGYYIGQVDIDGVIIRVDKEKQMATVIPNSDNITAETVVIPAMVTIEDIAYPVTTISQGAFKGYNELSEVTLPQTLTVIGDSAFADCVSLSVVNCHAKEVPIVSANVFDDACYTTATLKVPYDMFEKYNNNAVWKLFGNIEICYKKGDVTGDSVIDVDDIVAIVNYILGEPSESFIPEAADINGDNIIDVDDVVAVVNQIMNGNSNYNARQMMQILLDYGFKF